MKVESPELPVHEIHSAEGTIDEKSFANRTHSDDLLRQQASLVNQASSNIYSGRPHRSYDECRRLALSRTAQAGGANDEKTLLESPDSLPLSYRITSAGATATRTSLDATSSDVIQAKPFLRPYSPHNPQNNSTPPQRYLHARYHDKSQHSPQTQPQPGHESVPVIGATAAGAAAGSTAFHASRTPISPALRPSSPSRLTGWPPDLERKHSQEAPSTFALSSTAGTPSSIESRSSSQIYSFVPIPSPQQRKRPRRRFDEIDRMYRCGFQSCDKAYGTLNHLNAHVTMHSHGKRRVADEFKEIRKEWKQRKKELELHLKNQDSIMHNDSFQACSRPAKRAQASTSDNLRLAPSNGLGTAVAAAVNIAKTDALGPSSTTLASYAYSQNDQSSGDTEQTIKQFDHAHDNHHHSDTFTPAPANGIEHIFSSGPSCDGISYSIYPQYAAAAVAAIAATSPPPPESQNYARTIPPNSKLSENESSLPATMLKSIIPNRTDLAAEKASIASEAPV